MEPTARLRSRRVKPEELDGVVNDPLNRRELTQCRRTDTLSFASA